MEVLIHLLDLQATGRDHNRVCYVSVSKTHFLECNFCPIKKKNPKQNNLQLFPVDCGIGTCGSQIFHCAEGRKQEELFIYWTVFGTTNLSECIERRSVRNTADLFSSTANLFLSSEITLLSCWVEMARNGTELHQLK